MANNNQNIRQQIRNQLLNSAKGGRPGEWTSRKAELAEQLYNRACEEFPSTQNLPSNFSSQINQWLDSEEINARGQNYQSTQQQNRNQNQNPSQNQNRNVQPRTQQPTQNRNQQNQRNNRQGKGKKAA